MAIKTTPVQDVFSIDLRSLALYRILLGAILLLDVINRMTLIPAFYSDNGIVPRSFVQLNEFEHVYYFQILFLNGGDWLPNILFSVLLLFSICLFFGYRTKLSAFAVWLILCSLIVRNGLIANSGDDLLILLLFWSLFLPLGKVFSIDSLRRNKTVIKQNHFSVASVGMYVQVAAVYITTGLHKAQFPNWLNGSHLYNTFSLLEYIDPAAFLIYSNYELLEVLTYATLAIELLAPLLFFIPVYFFAFRMAGIILLLGLQVSIILFMDVGVFSYVSIAGILIFIPTQFWKMNMIRNSIREFQQFFKGIENKIKAYSPFLNQTHQNTSYFKTKKFELIKNGILSIIVLYVVLWNIDDVSQRFELPDDVKKAGYYLKLDQSWKMFSGPTSTSEYYSIQAVFDDGHQKNLLKPLQSAYETPDGIEYTLFRYNRWRKFFENEIKYGDRVQIFSKNIVDYFVSRQLNRDEKEALREVQLIQHVRTIGKEYNHSEFYSEQIYSKKYN